MIIGDVVVPASELPAALKEVAGKADELGIMVALFGHISDGNIHANIFAEPGNIESMSKEEEFQRYLGKVALEHGVTESKESLDLIYCFWHCYRNWLFSSDS